MINRIKNNKLLLLIVCFIGIVLIALAVRGIYALLTNKNSEDLLTIINDEQFEFIASDDLSIKIDASNLPKKGENIEVITEPKIKLHKSNSGEKIVNGYFLYLDITENTFEYSTSRRLPEVILTVIDPNGKELTSISGFNYATTFGVSGFDITGYKGIVKIAIDKEIYSLEDSEKIDNWKIKVTYLSLDNNNTTNANAVFSGKVSLYGRTKSLANYVNSLHTKDGENDIYFHDSLGEYGSIEANDYSYRFAGKNPNNYICLNNDTPCKEDNLYRIIGTFNFGDTYYVKVIKASELVLDDSSDNLYYWSGSIDNLSNKWEESTLNTNTLNSTLLEKLNINDIIADAPWTNDLTLNVKSESSTEKEYISKIGLMYVNDYYYGATPSNWKENKTGNENWLFTGKSEWTISKDGNNVYYIDSDGSVKTSSTVNPYYVRPVFYLDKGIVINGEHKGTSTDPYRFI